MVEPWLHAHIRVNEFSYKEWRSLKLRSLHDWSIGEEQSESLAIAADWSPPGIAKHDRCALAVLTTNLVLSIWVPGPDPSDVVSWKRVLLVNNVLEESLQNQEDQQSLNEAPGPSRNLRKRIRAAAWAPNLSPSDISERPNTANGILAVLVDSLEVVFVAIRSSYDGTITKVHPEPLRSHALDDSKDLNIDGTLEKLSWEPWSLESRGYNGVLKCTRRSVQHTLYIHAQDTSEEHPTLRVLDVHCEIATGSIAGWTHLPPQVPPNIRQALESSITRHKQRFSAEHTLWGKVTTKIWGMAKYQSFHALCITLHPTEHIEYYSTGMMESHLVFADESAPGLSQIPSTVWPWETTPILRTVAEAHAMPWRVFREILTNVLPQTSQPEDYQAMEIVERNGMIPEEHGIAGRTKERSVNHTNQDNLSCQSIYLYICGCMLSHPIPLLRSADKEIITLCQHALKDEIREEIQGISDMEIESSPDATLLRVNELTDLRRRTMRDSMLEICQICDETMFWDSTDVARCSSGHGFGTTTNSPIQLSLG